jgi:hypothetical protein
MEEQNSDWFFIRTQAAAQALANPDIRRCLEPFLGQACTVTDAARLLEVAPNAMLYRIRQLLNLGLLQVAWVQARPGKAIKHYRAISDQLFVPFGITPAETLETLVLPLEHEWQARFVRNTARALEHSGENIGLRIWRDANGTVIAKPTLAPPAPFDISLLELLPVLSIWADLSLSNEDVQELHHELLRLFERFSKRSGPSRHLLHLAVTPTTSN